MKSKGIIKKTNVTISVTYFMPLYCLDTEQGKHRADESYSISFVNKEVKKIIVKISAMVTMTYPGS